MHLSDIFPRITERVVILLNALCYFMDMPMKGLEIEKGLFFQKG